MRRAAVTAHASIRGPVPVVELIAPDWHTLSFGCDARLSMDTETLREVYLALRAHLIRFGELPTSLEAEAGEARAS
jgi:hypothetical protein